VRKALFSSAAGAARKRFAQQTLPRRNLLPPGKNQIRAPSAGCADGRKSVINQIKKNL